MIGPHRVTGFVMARNEERNIVPCLRSMRWVDDLIVIDSFSTDATVELSRAHADRVVQHPYECYSKQLEYALSLVETEWVAYLDADERFTPEAIESIRTALSMEDVSGDAFEFPRLAWFMNRWIRHGGWYPKPRIRVFRKSLGYVAGDEPHINIGTRGTCRELSGNVLHITYRAGMREMIQAGNTFSSVAAQTRKAKGKSAHLAQMLLAPPLVFLKKYLLQLGVLDGMAGFMIAAHSACYEWWKHIKRMEMDRLQDPPEDA